MLIERHGRIPRRAVAFRREYGWPEGNTLLSGSAIDPDSMEPDYNAVVTIEPV